MAGLGEACTHVGAVLFYLETATKVNSGTTCTQQKCQWVIPTYQKAIPYLPVKDIDFTPAKGKRRKFDASTSQQTAIVNSGISSVCGVTETSDAQRNTELCSGSSAQHTMRRRPKLDAFFQTLSRCCTKPGILSVVDPYSDSYIPKTDRPSFPKPLQQLYDQKYISCSYIELLNACEKVEVMITEEMAVLVELETRDQSNCKLWFTYRAGRITASRMKSVCHTDSSNPSQSLVKTIVYPEAFRFTSKATSWGCKHERKARDYYEKQMMGHHGFVVSNSGLSINPKWPHLGTSPDGMISCHCCGKGVVEIKCPYCYRNDDIDTVTIDSKQFCLCKHSNGNSYLDKGHAYYYQVQTQIFICDVEYCDFVVCTFPESQCEPTIHIERIFPDGDFWSNCVDKSLHFFKVCILPEILGRWYSRPPPVAPSSTSSAISLDCTSPPSSAMNSASTSLPSSATNSESTTSPPSSSAVNSALYCYCKQPDDGHEMIGCDNSACVIEWFHITCLKIKSVPKGRWYCPSCRILPEFKRGSKRTRQS